MAEKQEWEKLNDELLRQLRLISESLDRISSNMKGFSENAQKVADELKAVTEK